ncbi:MAG: glycoside hydrolase family 108 protein [Ignavibacteriaceae bacterium]
MNIELDRTNTTGTDFLTSFNKALANEGFISNNPNDKGGFTYKGISRTKHPSWTGWKIIDSILRSTGYQSVHASSPGNAFVQQLNNNIELQSGVTEFYRTEFWNKIQGDLLPSQLIADELFESSINIGVPIASEILQRTIILLNRNTHLYPDITVDGIIGNQTLTTLNKCVAENGEKLLFNLLNFYQAKRYIEIMERDHSQEIFIGWFNRIEIIK